MSDLGDVTSKAAPDLSALSLDDLRAMDRTSLEERSRTLAGAVYLGDHRAVCRILGRYKLFVDTRDQSFAPHLMLDGFWEAWLTIYMLQRVRPGMHVVDVGANFGYYSVLLADLAGPEGRLAAIEPNHSAADALESSLALNGVSKWSSVSRLAATDSAAADLLLFEPDGAPINATIVKNREATGKRPGALHTVRGATVDTLLESWPRVDFLKIDVEGAEEKVIRGLSGVITRHQPEIVLEYNVRRYADPKAFLESIAAVYPVLRHVNWDGAGEPVSMEQVLTTRVGEDWLLILRIDD